MTVMMMKWTWGKKRLISMKNPATMAPIVKAICKPYMMKKPTVERMLPMKNAVKIDKYT